MGEKSICNLRGLQLEPRDFSQRYSTDSTYFLLVDMDRDGLKPGKINNAFRSLVSLVGSFYIQSFRALRSIASAPVRGNPAVASFLIIGIFASLMGAGTYAYFSDTETSTDNTLTAGILDLWINGNTTGTWFVNASELKPGMIKNAAPLLLRIVDNPGKLYMKISGIACDQGNQTPMEMAAEGGVPRYDLDTVTWFGLNVNGNQVIPDQSSIVSSLLGQWISLGTYERLTDIPLIQSFHLKLDTGDWAQGDYCNITETFMVLQTNAPSP